MYSTRLTSRIACKRGPCPVAVGVLQPGVSLCTGATDLGCYEDTNVVSGGGGNGKCTNPPVNVTVAYCVGVCQQSSCVWCTYALVAKKNNNRICCDCVASLSDAALTPAAGQCSQTCNSDPCGTPPGNSYTYMNAYFYQSTYPQNLRSSRLQTFYCCCCGSGSLPLPKLFTLPLLSAYLFEAYCQFSTLQAAPYYFVSADGIRSSPTARATDLSSIE